MLEWEEQTVVKRWLLYQQIPNTITGTQRISHKIEEVSLMQKRWLAALTAAALTFVPLTSSSAATVVHQTPVTSRAHNASAATTTAGAMSQGNAAAAANRKKPATPPRGQVTRPDFPPAAPGAFNTKVVSGVHWQLRPAYDTPLLVTETGVTIAGPAEATQEQMLAFIRRRNPQPKLTCTLEELVGYYYEEAGREGVRPDVALCQALKETGFFNYGGDVDPKQNNFCGLGATGNHEPGARFATAQLGVRAHIQHLLAYSRLEPPRVTVNDPRYWLVVNYHPEIHGQILLWTGLNGVWAVPGKNYGQDILHLWQQAQAPDASPAALDAAQRKVTQSPDEAASFIYRGNVWYERGDYAAAVRDFSQALKLDATRAEALYDRALAYEKQGNTKAARKDYGALLQLQPNHNQAWYNRGLLRLAQRDYAGAIRDMQSLLALEDRSADAQNLIGVALIYQKHYPEAWQAFATAAQISSTNYYILANQIILQACLK